MKSQKGQSLVELAISFVIVLILLSGAVELGIGMFQQIQLRDAAQEGALYGSVCQDKNMIEQRVRQASSSPIDLENEDLVGVSIEDTKDENGIPIIKVSMLYSHKVFMPFASIFAGEYIEIKAHVVDTILTRNTNCE